MYGRLLYLVKVAPEGKVGLEALVVLRDELLETILENGQSGDQRRWLHRGVVLALLLAHLGHAAIAYLNRLNYFTSIITSLCIITSLR